MPVTGQRSARSSPSCLVPAIHLSQGLPHGGFSPPDFLASARPTVHQVPRGVVTVRLVARDRRHAPVGSIVILPCLLFTDRTLPGHGFGSFLLIFLVNGEGLPQQHSESGHAA